MTPLPRVVMVDGVPMSALVTEVADPRAVIVAIHGGATSSAYFDCPGRPELSLLRSAAEADVTAVALDRPGYGASALWSDEMAEPDRRVELAYGAVDRILGDADRGAGLVVVAHSAGCELALRMVVDDRGRDVIGLALAGTGLRYRPEALALIKLATANTRPAGLRDLLWAPTELYPPEVLTGVLAAQGVAYEARVTANWTRRDFAELAARVSVPVQFGVADHEAVWESSAEAVAAIAAGFTNSPAVTINEMADSGHNLSVGLTAGVYHQRVLTFLDGCVAAGTNGGGDGSEVHGEAKLEAG